MEFLIFEDEIQPHSTSNRLCAMTLCAHRRRELASRHLVCDNRGSWIQHESLGCGNKWAETRGDAFEFTCKGCTEAAALVKEVEGLKQMVEDM